MTIRPASHPAPAPRAVHETRLHSRQSGARQCGGRQHQDAGRGQFALCALGAAARPQGHGGACCRGAPNSSRNISRPCAICARAALRWRPSTGAGRACRTARSPTATRAMCAISRNTKPISTPSWSRWCCPTARRRIFCLAHSMGGAVAMRACHAGSRWFDRVVLSAPMIALPPGRFTGMAGPLARASCACSGAAPPMCRAAAPGVIGTEDFLGNVLTSDPVRFARNARGAGGGAGDSASARRPSPGPTPRCAR